MLVKERINLSSFLKSFLNGIDGMGRQLDVNLAAWYHYSIQIHCPEEMVTHSIKRKQNSSNVQFLFWKSFNENK
jgi:hypothetical protein